jgi:hypothetical protein
LPNLGLDVCIDSLFSAFFAVNIRPIRRIQDSGTNVFG